MNQQWQKSSVAVVVMMGRSCSGRRRRSATINKLLQKVLRISVWLLVVAGRGKKLPTAVDNTLADDRTPPLNSRYIVRYRPQPLVYIELMSSLLHSSAPHSCW